MTHAPDQPPTTPALASRTHSDELAGKFVFLSASVPEPARARNYLKVPNARLYIEEAVISLARGVFARGGRLVLGGHPTIPNLLAAVAAEYVPLDPQGTVGPQGPASTAPVVMYQSEVFRPHIPPSSVLLEQMGYAALVWTLAAPGEQFDPTLVPQGQGAQQQVPRSLEIMRETMLGQTSPMAMVAIGGMEGVELEAEMFAVRGPQNPIYVLPTTGGAAALLAPRGRIGNTTLRATDHQVMDVLRARRPQLPPTTVPSAGAAAAPVPYALVMQVIVDELVTGQRWSPPPP